MSDFAKFVKLEQSEEPEAKLVRAASECLDRFTAFFNVCDANGMDGELHFPHVMLSGPECLDWPEAGQDTLRHRIYPAEQEWRRSQHAQESLDRYTSLRYMGHLPSGPTSSPGG